MDLVESAARKCAVIDRLIRAAGIANARAVRARAEEWGALPAPAGGGARATTRSPRARSDRSRCSPSTRRRCCASGGVLVAWKGERDPAEEERGGARPPRRSGWSRRRAPRWCRSRAPATATCT